MANIRSIALSGFGRAEESAFKTLFDSANRRVGGAFRLVAEAEAQALIIDADSIYGQMGLMQAQGSGKLLIALTAGSRVDADLRLPQPAREEDLVQLFRQLAEGAPEPAVTTASRPAPAPAAPPASASAPAPRPVPAAAPAPSRPEAAPAPREPRPPCAAPQLDPPAATPKRLRSLFELLQPGVLTNPVRLQRGAAPALVIDPQGRSYLGGTALKPLLEYLKSPVAEAELKPVAAAELAALEAQLGGRQPLNRLLWLAALVAGEGQLIGFEPTTRFKLGKWPQIEREFPKHFRIATVMMKAAATVDEIAAASGASREEVCDLLNAYLATGFAEPEQGQASAAAETARTGLLDRLRGLRS